MNTEEMDRILKHTLGDMRLSRGEKRVLASTVQQLAGSDEHKLAIVRSRAFEIAKQELIDPDSIAVLDWLEEVCKVLVNRPDEAREESDAFFSPKGDCVGKINGLFALARSKVDICVFTITDDRITSSIREAHDRGVKIRIISDNDKALDPGSDIYRLRSHGIEVHTDRTSDHMHHKYAVFDNVRLLTGSYNWTRSAAEYNEENFIVTNDGRLVFSFSSHFEQLWQELA